MKWVHTQLFLKLSSYKNLLENYSYLSLLKLTKLLLPLITYPYLIRVLGKDTYGLVVYAQAIIGYCVIIVSFGFNISATQRVSKNRKKKEILSRVVSSVIIIKLALFFVTSIILIFVLDYIPKAEENKSLFLLTLWMCLDEVLFPIWYFQGIEKMKYITIISLCSKSIFFISIFIFIKSPDNYILIPILNGIGVMIGGIYALYIIFIKHEIKFKLQKINILKLYLMESVPIFISNVSVHLYVSTNKVLVGSFMGMTEVAYYDLAEKITSVAKIPQSILSQTIFPKISKEKNIIFIKKIFNISLILNSLLFFTFLLFSDILVQLLGGKEMLDAVKVVNILLLTVPIIGISNVLGIQVLIPYGYKKIFSSIIVSSGVFYVISVLFANYTIGLGLLVISYITVFMEIYVLMFMYYFINKLNLWNNISYGSKNK